MKAILIIEMPDCCTRCKFCNDETGFCTVLSKWVNNISNTRDYYCPLKPMPEKEEGSMWNTDIGEYYEGYNACIDEIIGEEE